MTNEQITGMLEDIAELEQGLTDWEMKFTDSLRSQFEARGTLSPKQVAKLEQVHKEKVLGEGRQ